MNGEGADEFTESPEEFPFPPEGEPGWTEDEPGTNEFNLRGGEEPPLRFLGGLVQSAPKVHIIFWGSNWQSEPGTVAKGKLLTFYNGLAKSSYNGILTQYFDSTSRITQAVTVDSVVDSHLAAPAKVTRASVLSEIAEYAGSGKLWAREANAQFEVLPAPGSTFDTTFAGHYCAFHGVDASESVFSFVPYEGDEPFKAGHRCQNYSPSQNAADATVVMASHEYAESATDPRWDTAPGWKNIQGFEVGDICATAGYALANGSVVQALYDDHKNECATADESPPFVLGLTDNPSNIRRHRAVIGATVNPESAETKYQLEWGPTTAYGTKVPAEPESVGSGRANSAIRKELSGLTVNQPYHYRVSATNATGTTYGEDRTVVPSHWLQQGPTTLKEKGILLSDVSCVNEESCQAVGSGPTAFQRLNGNWVEKPVPDAPGAHLFSVSCATENACTAVGRVPEGTAIAGVAERWNGTSWARQEIPAAPLASGVILRSVSCPSSSSCVAVGTSQIEGVWRNASYVWASGKWAAVETPTVAGATNGQLEGVSCESSGYCMAVGWYNTGAGAAPTSLLWDGGKWTLKSPAGSHAVLYSVSCPSSKKCVAVGGQNKVEVWNGTTWSIANGAAPQSAMWSVSCISETHCTAVGAEFSAKNGAEMTVAESTSDGETWSLLPTSRESETARNELVSVSCGGPVTCTAVGYSLVSGSWHSMIVSRRVPDVTPTYQLSFGGFGSEKGQFNRPWGLTVDASGNILVADRENGRIEKFNSNGEFQTQIGAKGTGAGQILEPTDVAVAPNGDIWVADGGNNRVDHFNAAGVYQSQFEVAGTEPTGIDVAADGSLWVAVGRANSVKHFTTSGTLITSFAGFEGLRGLDVDQRGNVWTTEWSGNRVTKLSPTGEVLLQFGYKGSGEGEWEEPWTVAVKPSGNVLVGDRWGGRVEEFSPEGEYEGQIGTKGSGTGQMKEPRGVALGPGGVIYISDTYNNRVEKWVQPAAPEPITSAPSSVEESKAMLNGTVNPGGLETTYRFEYGTTTEYGSVTTPMTVAAGRAAVPINTEIAGLQPNTTYHARLIATNSNGLQFAEDKTFTTPLGIGEKLGSMAVVEPFNGTTESITRFSSNWSTLGWANGTNPKGSDTTTGWRPLDAYSAVNGTYYNTSATDSGKGVASVITMAVSPGSAGRYFSLWLDATGNATKRSGYELQLMYLSGGGYTATLSKWQSGTQTVLATKTPYSLSTGNSVALVDKGSVVSAWVNSGSGFTQFVTATDSTYNSGVGAIEGSGNITRLTNFKVGALP